MTVSVYDAFIGSLSLRQCSTASYSPNGSAVIARLSGGTAPYLVAGGQASPMASFSSMDLYNMITSAGIAGGLSVAAGTIVLPFQQRLQGSTFGGAGTNQTLTAANALAVISSISASQSSDMAIGNLDVHFRSTDGKTEPVTINVDQDLTAQAFQAAYKMGPVKGQVGADVAVAQIEGVTSVTINPGINVSVKAFDGSIWPTLLVIDRIEPTIDLTFEDFDALSRFNATYTSLTSLTAYLRKLADGGTFVSDATAGHISLTLTGGLVLGQTMSSGEGGDGSVTQRCIGKTLASSLTAAISV